MKNRLLYVTISLLFALTSLYSQTVPGTLASSATVCANTNSGILTLTGYTGNVVRWEYSLNGASLWTTIANTSSSYNYVNLAQTTYFRVVVQNTGFPALTSNTVCIKTDTETNGGIASVLSANECIGNNVKMNVSGYIGSIINWQYSTDNATTWNPIASSNDSISKYISNLTINTLYRASIKNGICPTSVSDSVLVNVMPLSVGGTVASSATVCSGINTNTINVTSNVGSIIRWESSLTGSSPWSTINNTSSSLTYSNLISNTYYRSIAKSGNCAEAPSSSVLISVDNNSNGGFITGTQSVCSSLNTGALNLNGNNGTIVQWEYSTNNGGSWATTAINTSIYNFNNLTQNTLYKVQVTNGVCSAAYSNTFLVTVNPLPTVNYTVAQGCQGKAINFTNTSIGTNSYTWDFKDGNSSTIFNPSHNYSTAGIYLVKLTATSTNGCTDSVSKSVTIYPKPNVAFTSVDSICGFNQVVFTNNTSIASGTITLFNWTFGDNTAISNAINPTHTYTVANTYLIKLVATSDNGCKDSINKSIEIFPKPSANFATNNVCKKTAASFINTSFINGGGILYNWDFGDAQTSTLTSPTHNYNVAGNYNISLITTSNHGCKDTIIKPIYINEEPDLLIDAANVCLTKTTAFTQTITPSVLNYTLNWNLGNGNFLSGNNPTYTYPVASNYQVTASLTTDSNCTSTQTKIITIYPVPMVSFNFNNVCSVDSAIMNNLSSISSGSVSFSWNFGNTTSSTIANPKVLYSTSGTYTIQLTTTSNYGCVDSLSKPILIFDSPTTQFNFSNVCDGSPIQFNNTSSVNSGIVTSNYWNFGDNTNSSLVNPSKQYLNFGSYPVTLQTTSSNGCTSNLTQTVNVFEGAIANFSFTSQCANQSIPFFNLTTLNNGTYNSFWNFGDTTTSLLNSPTHLYQFAGTKNVYLKVITNNGCVDSISKFVQSYAIPAIYAGKDTTISKGFGVQLNATGGNTYAWTPPLGLSNPVIANPIANPEETTTYVVEGTSINGCFSSDTIKVIIDDSYLVIPYNIITPNGNDKNDVWYVKNIESYPNNKVTIMDEWGVVIYEKAGYLNNWDGKNKRGEILPDGTYYYVLTFDGTSKVYKGFVSLLRNK